MRINVSSRLRKVGMPPESFVHTGEKQRESVKISVIDYGRKGFVAKGFVAPQLPERKRKAPLRWIDVEGLHDVEFLKQLGDQYNIHPLALEDILQTDQRPKMVDYESHLFIVLKMLRYETAKQRVEGEQVSIVLEKDSILTFQEGMTGDVFDPIRNRIRMDNGQIRSVGTDYLVYSLMDAVVDQYFVILEALGDRIAQLEEHIIENPTAKSLQEILRLKHELMFVRKSIWSLREVVGQMERGDSPLIRPVTIDYLGDLHDHVIAAIETLESYRETLSGLVDIAMTSMSNRMNEIMKMLTIIATIFIPLTFVVGIYGMNFNTEASPWNMPELRWRFGYPAVLVVMGLAAFLMVVYFKRKKWL